MTTTAAHPSSGLAGLQTLRSQDTAALLWGKVGDTDAQRLVNVGVLGGRRPGSRA
ncbi:hypothetical protein GCM10027169_10450 [Gordonia jinhuaensis]|uniref:Uncharacterized protein n=1 Tax=Gordonia jinhuaensis TaxID=1517702 RepID=A0A916SV85_9ACTN|nr:hypothetical protein [Gordonia jinhuaensis]GGB19575.1 hypothetical protein GCM10011489_04610 [Gordonia jinhuaensis]